jgi:hypothetical protein
VTVHVMAPPDESIEVPLPETHSLCESANSYHEVVFHPNAVQVGLHGWACPECGVTSQPEGSLN